MTEATPRGPTSAALASPKVKQKPNPTPGSLAAVAFGCEHTQAFHKTSTTSWKTLSSQYDLILKTIFASNSSKSQTVRVAKDTFRSTLRPSYLCLQCPMIFAEEGMRAHFEGPKAHSLFVESRNGMVYCNNCEDFIYDPTLETLRLRAVNPGLKKRKFDEFAAVEASSPIVTLNSAFVPCRAIGLRGLYNMGNTCFMSVVIQSLLHNPFIKTWYLSEGHKSDSCERDACTSCALEEIFAEFWSGEKTEGYGAVPMLLSSWKSAEHLAGYQQQDAHEYMQFILNSLHSTNTDNGEGGSASETSSDHGDCECVIHKTFYGKLQSTVTCNDCRNKTTARDPFMDLSLDLRTATKKKKLNGEKKGKDRTGDKDKDRDKDKDKGDVENEEPVMRLEDCLARFTNEEKLAKEDYRCVKCEGQRDAVKQLSVRKLPPVLTVHLKRFSHAKDKSSKLETPVSFPLDLDMLPYTTYHQTNLTSLPPIPTKSREKTNGIHTNGVNGTSLSAHPDANAGYVLSAVIVHKGEINSGHYVSYAREGRDWFLFDDSKVVLVGEDEVLGAQAYLLIYVAGRI